MIATTNSTIMAKVRPDIHDKKVILHLKVCLFSLCTNLQINRSMMHVKTAAVKGDMNLNNLSKGIP